MQRQPLGTTALPKPLIDAARSCSDFQTPADALDPLLPYIPKEWTVWECAAGTGNLVNALRARGNPVIASDILTGEDFLEWEPNKHYNLILTNIPFHIKDDFLHRAVELQKPFAFLVRDSIFDSKNRRKTLKPISHELGLVFLPNRPRFITPNGTEGGSWFTCFWLTRGLSTYSPFVFPNE